MKLEHKTWSEAGGWEGESSLGEQREPQAMKALPAKAAQLVLLLTRGLLYEFDGKPVLKLYKTYLGEHAAGLPATGLHFPLSIQREDGEGSKGGRHREFPHARLGDSSDGKNRRSPDFLRSDSVA